MNEEVIHIKLEHSEAIQGKKELLLAEESLLKTNRAFSNYSPLRREEISEREKMLKKSTELKNILTRLEKTLPKIKVPRSIRKKVEEVNMHPEKTFKLKREVKKLSLEEELEEIQRKLKKIGA